MRPGFRYLSKTYNDEWMRRNGFLKPEPRMTVEHVLAARKRAEPVVAVGPDATLAEAIEAMMAHGISQMPVMDGDEVVGSLSERSVLNRLIEVPGARDEAVREAMAGPLPVVPPSVPLARLTALLDGEAGAVLIHAEPGGDGSAAGGYHIVTRSDLIAALARQSDT